MAKFKIALNSEGLQELLLSDEVRSMLEEEAQSRCPEGCEVDVQPGRKRQVARIKTATRGAYYQNFRDNRLLKAIGCGKKQGVRLGFQAAGSGRAQQTTGGGET